MSLNSKLKLYFNVQPVNAGSGAEPSIEKIATASASRGSEWDKTKIRSIVKAEGCSLDALASLAPAFRDNG